MGTRFRRLKRLTRAGLALVVVGCALDPFFFDLLGLYRNFEYKSMHLFQNTQLTE